MSTERGGAGPSAGNRAGGDWPAGYGLIRLERVDSTLDEARRRCGQVAGPTWIFARRQSAGRARRGRVWHDLPGKFAATLILPGPGAPARAALRSFVAALALADVLEGLGLESRLKWPNDVLLGGGKLAGILLEGLERGALGVGIGVNLAAAPDPGRLEPGALAPVALAALGVTLAPGDFLALLAGAYAAREASFAAHGFGPIRQAWLARAARLGERIRVRLPRESFEGIFRDLDGRGQLVLSTPQGTRHIAAGEVFF